MAKNNVSRYENNVQTPTIDTLKTLAVLYNTTADYILGLTDRSSIYIDDISEKHQKIIKGTIETLKIQLAENG